MCLALGAGFWFLLGCLCASEGGNVTMGWPMTAVIAPVLLDAA